MEKYKGLPVAGYQSQSKEAIDMVNNNKNAEELVLRMLHSDAEHKARDKPWLAIARTDIERGFMAMNRAIFNPKRIAFGDTGRKS